MKVINLNDDKWNNFGDLTLTIGNFDGIHLGHQQLIKEVKKYNDTNHAALTIYPHPNQFLRENKFYTLQSLDDKINNFRMYNLDYLFILDFNTKTSKFSIEDFINRLKDLGVKRLVLGRDFRFASKGSGSVRDLCKHFEVIVLDDILYKEERISTTYIKDLLKDGNLDKVKYLLDKNYQIKGLVEHGNKVGKTLGFPTANINYNSYILPKNGVYVVEVLIEDKKYYGVCNIGNNPTINYSFNKRVEVYIFDFNENIYDKEIQVTFLHYLREEMKFNSKEELINQLKDDEILGKKFILNNFMVK